MGGIQIIWQEKVLVYMEMESEKLAADYNRMRQEIKRTSHAYALGVLAAVFFLGVGLWGTWGLTMPVYQSLLGHFGESAAFAAALTGSLLLWIVITGYLLWLLTLDWHDKSRFEREQEKIYRRRELLQNMTDLAGLLQNTAHIDRMQLLGVKPLEADSADAEQGTEHWTGAAVTCADQDGRIVTRNFSQIPVQIEYRIWQKEEAVEFTEKGIRMVRPYA